MTLPVYRLFAIIKYNRGPSCTWKNSSVKLAIEAGGSQGGVGPARGVTQSVISAYESGATSAIPRPYWSRTGSRHRLRSGHHRRSTRKIAGQAPVGLIARKLSVHRHDAQAVLARHGLSNARVFGSVVRGEDTDDSDLDILIDVAPGVGLLGLARCERDLEALLGVQVDLVPPTVSNLQWRRRHSLKLDSCESRRSAARGRHPGGHRNDPRSPYPRRTHRYAGLRCGPRTADRNWRGREIASSRTPRQGARSSLGSDRGHARPAWPTGDFDTSHTILTATVEHDLPSRTGSPLSTQACRGGTDSRQGSCRGSMRPDIDVAPLIATRQRWFQKPANSRGTDSAGRDGDLARPRAHRDDARFGSRGRRVLVTPSAS